MNPFGVYLFYREVEGWSPANYIEEKSPLGTVPYVGSGAFLNEKVTNAMREIESYHSCPYVWIQIHGGELRFAKFMDREESSGTILAAKTREKCNKLTKKRKKIFV